MPVQKSSAPAPPRSSIAPSKERAPSTSNSPGDASTIDPPPVKKTDSKKTSKRKTSKRAKTTELVDPPVPKRPRDRYEPYRRAEPTPEREAALPADPEELETLDATAKKLYKSDREVLEYVETLRRRTAAMLEHVNRTDSQLRACKGAMGRIELYMGHWQKMEDRWTHQQLFGSGNFRAKWVDGKMEVLDSDESSDDDDKDNAPNPGLFPTLTRDENGAFPTVEEHLSKNIDHPDFPHDYAQELLGESAPQPTNVNNDSEEEDFSRPETPPARQPSLPPGHEDENVHEYIEDGIEIRSNYPAPPDHASLASNVPEFCRPEADLRVASDTDLPFPRSGEEHANPFKRFKREAMDFAAALMRPQTDPPRPRHPLAQSYVPSSPDPALRPEPQHLVVPHPVSRMPSPPRTVLAGKRKRTPTPEEEDNNAGNVAGPSTTIVRPAVGAPSQVEARDNEERVSLKRRRLISRQPSWDSQMFMNVGFVPAPPQVDPPTRENSPEPSSQPAHRQASPPPIPTSQVQKEDSEIERSQVIEMLSQEVDQGESEDEESTENILGGLGKSRRSLPALTADNTQSTTGVNTQSEAGTPAESQSSTKVLAPILEDVFGPVVLSVETKRILGTFEKDDDGDSIISDSGRVNVSSKSARFSFDGKAEKEKYKVFPKTPIRPRTSLRAIEAERALAIEAEAESQDTLNPLQSPKKKRTIGARARTPKLTPSIEIEPTVNPESGLPSASTGKPPSKPRRGRSTSVQPEVPAPPKTRSTRSRK